MGLERLVGGLFATFVLAGWVFVNSGCRTEEIIPQTKSYQLQIQSESQTRKRIQTKPRTLVQPQTIPETEKTEEERFGEDPEEIKYLREVTNIKNETGENIFSLERAFKWLNNGIPLERILGVVNFYDEILRKSPFKNEDVIKEMRENSYIGDPCLPFSSNDEINLYSVMPLEKVLRSDLSVEEIKQKYLDLRDLLKKAGIKYPLVEDPIKLLTLPFDFIKAASELIYVDSHWAGAKKQSLFQNAKDFLNLFHSGKKLEYIKDYAKQILDFTNWKTDYDDDWSIGNKISYLIVNKIPIDFVKEKLRKAKYELTEQKLRQIINNHYRLQ